jgi:hypothetical protein
VDPESASAEFAPRTGAGVRAVGRGDRRTVSSARRHPTSPQCASAGDVSGSRAGGVVVSRRVRRKEVRPPWLPVPPAAAPAASAPAPAALRRLISSLSNSPGQSSIRPRDPQNPGWPGRGSLFRRPRDRNSAHPGLAVDTPIVGVPTAKAAGQENSFAVGLSVGIAVGSPQILPGPAVEGGPRRRPRCPGASSPRERSGSHRASLPRDKPAAGAIAGVIPGVVVSVPGSLPTRFR